MTEIQEKLNTIENAIYGQDMRAAIHDAIELTYSGGVRSDEKQNLTSAQQLSARENISASSIETVATVSRLLDEDILLLSYKTSRGYINKIGNLISSNNWRSYYYHAQDLRLITQVTCYPPESVGSFVCELAFYNSDEPSSSTFISAIYFDASDPASAETLYNIDIPDDAVLVIICNRETTGDAMIRGIATSTPSISDASAELRTDLQTEMYTLVANNATTALAYVAGGAISWRNDENGDLKVTNKIILRSAVGTKTLEAEDLLTLAGNYPGLVEARADGSIRGYDFALIYNTAANGFQFVTTVNAVSYKNAIILFAHYYTNVAQGLLVESRNPYRLAALEPLQKYYTIPAIAYVSNKAISWKHESNNCDLLITDTINLITSKTKKTLTAPDLLALAAQYPNIVTVRSNNTLRGNSYALIYDYVADAFSFVPAISAAANYQNSVILFAHNYTSVTQGLLVDSLTDSRLYALEKTDEYAVPDYYAEEAADCQTKLQAACQSACTVIAFVTDSHYSSNAIDGANWPETAANIRRVNHLYPIDIAIHGGDITTGNVSKSSTVSKTRRVVQDMVRTDIPITAILTGNHDDNSYRPSFVAETDWITEGERYALYGRYFANFVHSVSNHNYFWFDIGDDLRIICLCSIIPDQLGKDNPNSWGYDNAQLTWFGDLLQSTQDKHVAVFSHMPFTSAFMHSSAPIINGSAMLSLLEAFNNDPDNGCSVVALFHGHCHNDHLAKATGSNIWQCGTGCSLYKESASQEDTPDSEIDGAVVAGRTIETATQDLWDIIVIKPELRAVQLIRFGAGADRSFTY